MRRSARRWSNRRRWWRRSSGCTPPFRACRSSVPPWGCRVSGARRRIGRAQPARRRRSSASAPSWRPTAITSRSWRRRRQARRSPRMGATARATAGPASSTPWPRASSRATGCASPSCRTPRWASPCATTIATAAGSRSRSSWSRPGGRSRWPTSSGLLEAGPAIGAALGRAGPLGASRLGLGRITLANYVAAALLMPYAPFLAATQALAYDVGMLCALRRELEAGGAPADHLGASLGPRRAVPHGVHGRRGQRVQALLLRRVSVLAPGGHLPALEPPRGLREPGPDPDPGGRSRRQAVAHDRPRDAPAWPCPGASRPPSSPWG